MLFTAIIAASSSCSAAPFLLVSMFALSIVAPLLAGLLFGKNHGSTLASMTQLQGIYKVARDGRSYIQVGRVCHFGRRGETEESLRARVSL